MKRNQTLELIRIFGAFGIVVFHAGAQGAEIGYSGLVAFVVLTIMFEAQSHTSRSVYSLARRLLLPWVFWSTVYIAARLATKGHPFHEGMNPVQSVLYGDHLWFLPFAFGALLLVRLLKQTKLPLAPISAAIAIAMLALSGPLREITSQAPYAQWLHALPAFFIGMAASSLAFVAVILAALVYLFFEHLPGLSIPYLVGAGAVLLARHVPPLRFNVEPVSTACSVFILCICSHLALQTASLVEVRLSRHVWHSPDRSRLWLSREGWYAPCRSFFRTLGGR